MEAAKIPNVTDGSAQTIGYVTGDIEAAIAIKQAEDDLFNDALHVAAQCWCDVETCTTTMDPMLCEAFANRLFQLARASGYGFVGSVMLKRMAANKDTSTEEELSMETAEQAEPGDTN